MKTKKQYTQKDKQKRGTDFEKEFRTSCNYYICEAHKMINGGYGTPYDYHLDVEGGAIALELKRTLNDRLGYSAITDNEREGLTKHESKVRTNRSFILCNINNENENSTYLIPWLAVSDDVCSGRKGSMKVKKYIEIPRKKFINSKTEKTEYGWDLEFLENLFVYRDWIKL
jgi:hypothetical protein